VIDSEDDDDLGATFRAMAEHSKQKRAGNRENSAAMLTAAGVVFESKNEGAHLVVHHHTGMIDFWPGTGLWIVRGVKYKGRGVRKLLQRLNRVTETDERKTDQ